MYSIFDTHAHYTSHQFDDDRHTLLGELPGRGVVGVVDCGTDYDSSRACLALAEQYPYLYAALGIHPESIIEEDASTNTRFGGDWAAELAAIRPLFDHPKAVAVGECGLDYHWPIPKEAQLALFEAHLKLALELDKPIIVHDRQAHADVYALLKQYRPKGVVHCFSGSAEDAVMLAQQGMYIGFGGALTFKGAKRAVKAAATLPLERILLETDCPYMAPEPCRGKRCDSGLIAHTGEFLAEVRGVAPDVIFTATTENAKRLFGV
ncbi:TatD family hydrolase [uncultured Allofournierella sp.]|uniref:TatD family hydrolase n=1 Tax=uncultured Allofournierella sp. TaxID=1940258 RepID=UPI0025D0CACC|nr:TatD family hydrolase [uncultured Fournierella sp.]